MVIIEGTLSDSHESFADETYKSCPLIEGNEHKQEVTEASQITEGTLIEEPSTKDEAESKSSMESLNIEGDKLDDELRSFETGKNQGGTSMKEVVLDLDHGILPEMESEGVAMADEIESSVDQISNEVKAVEGIGKEVEGSKLVSQKKLQIISGTRPMDDDDDDDDDDNDERDCDPIDGNINDVMGENKIEERDIDINLIMEELETGSKKRDEVNEILQDQKVSETDNESNNKESLVEKFTPGSGLEKDLKKGVEFEKPLDVFPEGLQTTYTNTFDNKFEREDRDVKLEENLQKDGDKVLKEETVEVEAVNQSNEADLFFYTTEAAIPFEEISEPAGASKEVKILNATNEEIKAKMPDELVDETTDVQASKSVLTMEKTELDGESDEQFEGIGTMD